MRYLCRFRTQDDLMITQRITLRIRMHIYTCINPTNTASFSSQNNSYDSVRDSEALYYNIILRVSTRLYNTRTHKLMYLDFYYNVFDIKLK